MRGAGAPRVAEESDEPTDATDEANWSITMAMAAVVVIALVVGVVALTDTRSGRPTIARPAAPAAPATDRPRATTTRQSTTRPSTTRPVTTRPGTTVARTTTTDRTTTTRPTATSTPPTTTTPPTPPTTAPAGPSLLPDGWYSVVATDGGFRAELPTSPRVTAPMVSAPTGTVPRLEYNAAGPAGSQVSVTSVPAPLDGRPAEELVDGAAGQVRRDLGGILHLGDRSTVDGGVARRFAVDVRGGRVLGLVVHRGATLHLVSMFEPGGSGPAPAAAFERVARSFHLLSP